MWLEIGYGICGGVAWAIMGTANSKVKDGKDFEFRKGAFLKTAIIGGIVGVASVYMNMPYDSALVAIGGMTTITAVVDKLVNVVKNAIMK